MTLRRELVEAGAGCGKTYGLVSRYLEGLGIDAETGKSLRGAVKLRPHQILAVTFTEEAATQMKERIGARLEQFNLVDLAKEVFEQSQISTFHGLCLKLLKPRLGALGYPETGELVPPPFARAQRSRHCLNSLAEHPEGLRLLRHLDLHELCDLAADLWFSTLKPENSASEAARALVGMAKRLEVFREGAAELCLEAFSAFPDCKTPDSKAWVLPFYTLLTQGNPYEASAANFALVSALQFRGGRNIAQQFPDLLRWPKI